MYRTAVLTLLLAASACERTDDFVGDDLGDPNGPDATLSASPSDFAFAESMSMIEITAACSPTPVGDEVLVLTGAPDQIEVAHSGWVGSDCAEWDIAAGADAGAGAIEVIYTDVAAQTCATTCEWNFTYTIADMHKGTWLVFAGSEKGLVDVP